MSFKKPKPPRLSAAAQPWRESHNTPIRKVYGRKNLVLLPQIDVQTRSNAFTHGAAAQPKAQNQASPARLVPLRVTPDKRLIEHGHWTHALQVCIPVYLSLLRRSNNLRSVSRTAAGSCQCPASARKLNIRVLSMEDIVSITVCACRPTQALLALGYFPSSPVRPSFAFDIKMLEFASQLYLRSPPNMTAWSSTLEAYLRGRGYQLAGVDIIRRKFAKAKRYYQLLVAETEVHVRKYALKTRLESQVEDSGDEEEWVDDDEELMDGDYLAECCVLCFGAVAEHDDHVPADVIVCLDACFVQKRMEPQHSSGHDAPLYHPRTRVLTDKEVKEAQVIVESMRPAPAPRTNTTEPPKDDSVETGMKVPSSVLDGCSESFKAADEKRSKASSKFFADTGLMALLCRHDKVLWLANMTTPGERQYYAIALLLKLFRALPSHLTVGILYDIGCQLHRSCTKWDFIPDYMDRIIWGIAIFHAYGHQWPCQLVYHPRKCVGFGLSDGEGCERFWSSIQKLVPPLRVSGYHQRIYTLDLQVDFLKKEGMMELGDWLRRKWDTCMDKKGKAQGVLDSCPFSELELDDFWKDQVATQTRPLVTATVNLAKNTIKSILDLKEHSKTLLVDIKKLDEAIAQGELEDVDEVMHERGELSAKRDDIEAQIRRKMGQLGVTDKQNLKALLGNKYLQVRMQARALKDRIQAKLRDRKFELDRLNRSYNQVSASERRLAEHVQTQVTRHEPSVVKSVTRFNKLCDDLSELIRTRKAPRHAVSPLKLDQKTIFSLDVDDPVWSDKGLTGEDVQVPEWLGNDDARDGIQAMLMIARCREEECYLQREVCFLSAWFVREWGYMEDCLIQCGLWFNCGFMHIPFLQILVDDDIAYYLKRQKATLLLQGALWARSLTGSTLVDVNDLNFWGPASSEFKAALASHFGARVEEPEDAESDSDKSDGSNRQEEEDLLESIEQMQLGGEEVDSIQEYLDLREAAEDRGRDEMGRSPRKRMRPLSDD
ncbi:hypothetical protein DFP72DRAFT_816334 [Ephemerocybe angulata]|uniref:CxC1-like cysteine cluster associated with KDZ transposases domain-containing protein n=1 Tax=Ephemerocybe angulata TaxID=980116 RepID=A0A8H6HR03_9AGAR|nr:hypothetical protein DFP72DRAFT_816334 [Tulosesus angulatus]